MRYFLGYLHDIGFMYSCHGVASVSLGVVERKFCNSSGGVLSDQFDALYNTRYNLMLNT